MKNLKRENFSHAYRNKIHPQFKKLIEKLTPIISLRTTFPKEFFNYLSKG